MTTVGCPLCDGPVTLDSEGQAECRVGHVYASDQLNHELTAKASRALWAAITALGDEATAVRWRASQESMSRDRLLREADEIEEQVRLLRNLTPRR